MLHIYKTDFNNIELLYFFSKNSNADTSSKI